VAEGRGKGENKEKEGRRKMGLEVKGNLHLQNNHLKISENDSER